MILILLIRSTSAQFECPPIYLFTGESAGDQFGMSVASAGDVDNDGYADLIVGAVGNDAGGEDAGRAYVFSGRTGEILHLFTGEAAGDQFGFSVSSAGDVNVDGHSDLIIGAPNSDEGRLDSGAAYVFSGLDGTVLFKFRSKLSNQHLGFSVALAGFVNNDSVTDLIIGAPSIFSGLASGRAIVISGLDGTTIQNFSGLKRSDLFGSSVASAGDVNHDGRDDLIVGAPSVRTSEDDAGWAYVFSGLDGDTLHIFEGENPGDLFGSSVSSAGDVNSDGKADLLIGAWFHDPNGLHAGRAYLFSGLNGDTLHLFDGESSGNNFGFSVAAAGDANLDGYADIMIGAFRNNIGGMVAGTAYVFSGKGDDTIHIFTGESGADQFGTSVASAGDVNNDGIPDFIVGGPYNDAGGRDAGRVYVYEGGCDCCSGQSGNLDCDEVGIVDITDLTVLINHLFINFRPICCRDQGNVDGDSLGVVDTGDLTALIDHLFLGLGPTAACR